jgi:4-hydroxyphenylpyruvate dioxygenase-like putative hemolysin
MRPIRYSMGFALALLAGFAFATPVRADGLSQVHLHVPDPQAAAAWYAKYMGGELRADGRSLTSRGITLLFIAQKPVAPSGEGAIDHIGFGTLDPEAKAEMLKAAGIKIEVSNGGGRVMVDDPWGGRIEVAKFPNGEEGFQHVHFMCSGDPEPLKAWLSQMGDEKVFIRGIELLQQNGVIVATTQSETPRAGSARHVLNSVGYVVDSIDAQLKRFAPGSTKVISRNKTAVVEGPCGATIELMPKS